MARASSLVVVLVVLGLSRPALAGEPTSVPRTTTPQVRQAVDRAVMYRQTESAAWLKTRKCIACHHVPMPLLALGEAERQGYAITELGLRGRHSVGDGLPCYEVGNVDASHQRL